MIASFIEHLYPILLLNFIKQPDGPSCDYYLGSRESKAKGGLAAAK
jgi:hypothetical protein